MPQEDPWEVEAEGPKLLADTLLEPGAWKEHKGGLCSVPTQPKGTFCGFAVTSSVKRRACLRVKEVPLEWRVQ